MSSTVHKLAALNSGAQLDYRSIGVVVVIIFQRDHSTVHWGNRWVANLKVVNVEIVMREVDLS